jgi:MerR family transcriptional regulator/heat shock protein HspR
VQRLSQEEGVNLAGVKRILDLDNHVRALRRRIAELQDELEASRREATRLAGDVERKYRRDLVPVRDAGRQGAVVVWRPQPRR